MGAYSKETCSCNDYQEGMIQIIDAQRLLFVTKGMQYTGKKINFCPWCGKKLQKRKLDV